MIERFVLFCFVFVCLFVCFCLYDVFINLYLGLVGEKKHTKLNHQTTSHSKKISVLHRLQLKHLLVLRHVHCVGL